MRITDLCPACASAHKGESYRIPDHEYGISDRTEYTRCGDCGTLYQARMPSVQELAHFYPVDYHSFAAGGWMSRMRNRTRLARLKALIPTERAVILDYCCGDGTFIAAAA